MLTIHHQPPTFTTQDAERIAGERYGLRVSATLLPGEHDQNFLLKSAEGEAFVLKIAHADEQYDMLDFQNSVLQYLATHAPALIIPRVCASVDGKAIITVVDSKGNTHSARLLTFIPGKPLAATKPHTPALLHDLGRFLGELDLALLNLSHHAMQRPLKWDLARAAWIHDYLPYIENSDRRALVVRFLAQFEEQVVPVLPALRTSVIHNDANDYNVLVYRPSIDATPAPGLVDFGDMLYTQTIGELAIAATYAMMNKSDPLATAAQLVAGYHEAFPLTEQELAILFPLICTRLCISVVNAAYQRHAAPENDYLQISQLSAWALLEQLADIAPAFAYYTFRATCGLSTCPQTESVVHWLRDNADQIGKLVEPELSSEHIMVFDLSVGSLELGNVSEWSYVQQFTQKLFARLKAAGKRVGIGRYNETRPIYTSDLYRVASNDGYERRTVHLALDLFMAPGSPVYAPLDCVVHSFANNAAVQDFGPTIILQHTVSDKIGNDLTFYTLYGHLTIDSLNELYEGKPLARGTLFARIGDIAENGGWPPHLHFQIITDMLLQYPQSGPSRNEGHTDLNLNNYTEESQKSLAGFASGKRGEFPGVARPSERDIWLSLSPDPNLIVRLPMPCTPTDEMSIETILTKRAQHLGPSLSISYRQPLKIVRGWRQYLYDQDGQPYLDAVNNVCHVGHCHPRVVKAGQEQMSVLNTNTRYLHENLVAYAERLCATLPESLRVCFFVCSGSEANELALRLARAHTGRKDIIVLDAAYHGNTTSLVEISPYKFDGPGGFAPPSFVHTVPLPDTYRGQYRRDDPHAGEKYARFVKDAIEENQGKIGAFICESLPGCGGQIVLPDGYLQAAYQHVQAAGGVCIADEGQIGFGRVGSHFWGYETQSVIPDIVTMGKPIGNGHPLAAVVTTPEIAASFDNGMEYFNTFGGNPVACAIGLSVLDVIEEEGLQANALEVGAHLMDGLRALMDKHPLIGDVRGLGLFIGIELVLDRATLAPAPAQASYIVNRLRERGILLSVDGPYHNVLKIKPPLVFNAADAKFLIAELDMVLDEMP